MDGRVQYPWSAIHFSFRCVWLHTTLLCALEGRAFAVHGGREVWDQEIIHPVPGLITCSCWVQMHTHPALGAARGWSKNISTPQHNSAVDCKSTSRCNTHLSHCTTPNNHTNDWVFRLASSTVTAVTPRGVVCLKAGSKWFSFTVVKGQGGVEHSASEGWASDFHLQIWKLPLAGCLSLRLRSTDTVLVLSTLRVTFRNEHYLGTTIKWFRLCVLPKTVEETNWDYLGIWFFVCIYKIPGWAN